ncbi:MAG: DUF1003 domain-containing protein [Nanoarchaeota archaeon]|nr:DUF1003 domain-containing protein [Nanoarchaeota archaeon]MBU1027658.1 DUF1003 domain-containing protein [Nanoarchaeota archaeon]
MKKEVKIKKEIVKRPKFQINHPLFKLKKDVGQRAADWITKWAGSWIFIISFLIFIFIWMTINIYAWINTWDPYPFILLNLLLSCLAALQAPIILMSQNRQAQRDRLKAEYDYRINKKAEREIQEIKKMLQKHFKK